MITFNPQYLLALIPFVVVSVVHLIFAFQGKDGPRAITKLLLVPTLSIYPIVVDRSATLLILALLFSFMGDIFMIYKDNRKSLLAGFLTFALSHMGYIIVLVLKMGMDNLPFYPWIIGALVLIAGGSFVFIQMLFKNKAGQFKLTMVAYSFLLMVELALAGFGLIIDPNVWSILLVFGIIFFISSDTYLGITIFLKPQRFDHFFVMFLYIAAQLLIVVSLLHY